MENLGSHDKHQKLIMSKIAYYPLGFPDTPGLVRRGFKCVVRIYVIARRWSKCWVKSNFSRSWSCKFLVHEKAVFRSERFMQC